MTSRGGGGWMLVAVCTALGVSSNADAQNFRGWVNSSVRYFELQPISLDSVPRSSVITAPNGALLFDGREVTCITANVCTLFSAAGTAHTTTITEDIALTAWGFGVRGLSVTTLVRGRARSGGGVVFPRTDDSFDAILAYAELNRGRVRARVGRLETASGLGFSGYDGGSLSATVGGVRIEGFGGRSLSRGLQEPRTEALRGIEDFVTDNDAWLIGGSGQLRLPRGTSIGARYQREILSDRSVLVSERASFDVRTSALRWVKFNGSADYDFAFGNIGKASASASYLIPGASLMVEVTGRRYVPYFDLSTIWGFFSPVAYHEGGLRVSWWKSRDLGLWVSGARRYYEDTNTVGVLSPLTDTGWRGSLGGTLRPAEKWTLDGQYRVEWGPGAFLSSGDVGVRWAANERFDVGLSGTAFQQIEEFRVGEGRTYGMGLNFGAGLISGARLSGGATVFRQRPDGRASERDWDQFRAWSSLRIEIGRDPGMRGGR